MIHSDFGRTKIDGLLFPMSPVNFSMSVCNLGRMGFVDLCQFVYNNLQDCSPEEIRPQQNENSVVAFFMPPPRNEKNVVWGIDSQLLFINDSGGLICFLVWRKEYAETNTQYALRFCPVLHPAAGKRSR